MQWLIARRITHNLLSYQNINIPDLDKLRGTNQEATPRVPQVFGLENTQGEPEGYFVKEKTIRVQCFYFAFQGQ